MIKVLKKVNYLRKQRNYKKFIDNILKVVDFTNSICVSNKDRFC